jgi:hypothetical protein
MVPLKAAGEFILCTRPAASLAPRIWRALRCPALNCVVGIPFTVPCLSEALQSEANVPYAGLQKQFAPGSPRCIPRQIGRGLHIYLSFQFLHDIRKIQKFSMQVFDLDQRTRR